MSRLPQEILSELREAVFSRKIQSIKGLVQEFRMSLPEPLNKKHSLVFALSINRATLDRWESGKSIPHPSHLTVFEKLANGEGLVVSKPYEPTFSKQDLEYLIEVVEGLDGPMPLSTAISLVRLRKKN